ncbi:hypothetical protein DFJ74DRAFT_397474 [Hyaloraphidium curvatum]|nr:hypothetical protein DFJ74DRAFT_397474 [Hyaloraphidium curvatum]
MASPRQLSNSPDPTSSEPPSATTDIVAPLIFNAIVGSALMVSLVALVWLANRQWGKDKTIGDAEAGDEQVKRPERGFWATVLAKYRAGPPPGSKSSSVLGALWSTSIDEIALAKGEDAATVLAFLRTALSLFVFLSLLFCPVLIPLHATAQPNADWLSSISIVNLPSGSDRLPVHLAIGWILVLVSAASIGGWWGAILSEGRRRHWREPKDSAVMVSEAIDPAPAAPLPAEGELFEHAVLLLHIPPDLRTEHALRGFLGCVVPGSRVACVEFVRDTSDLEKTVGKRMDAIERIEAKLQDAWKAGVDAKALQAMLGVPAAIRRPTDDVKVKLSPSFLDSLEADYRELRRLEFKIADQRRAVAEHVDRTKRCAAFVAFDDADTALAAARALLAPSTYDRPVGALNYVLSPRFRIVAGPAMADIAWSRLGKRTPRLLYVARTLGVWATVLAISVAWTIPVGFIVGLLNLDNLANLFPWLQSGIEALPPAAVGLIQGLIPALVVSIWQALLPSLLLAILKFLPPPMLPTLPALALALFRSFHVYLLFNLIFVIPLSSGLFSTLTEIIIDPGRIPKLLGDSLVNTGSFFVNYVQVQAFTSVTSAWLLRPLDILTVLLGIFFFSKWTARKKENFRESAAAVRIGSEMVTPVLVLTLGLVFAQVQPLILPFVSFYFLMLYFSYKFSYIFWHQPPGGTTGHGMARAGLAAALAGRCLLALVIQVLTLLGILTTKGLYVSAPVALTILLGCLIVFWRRCERVLGDLAGAIRIGKPEADRHAGVRGLSQGSPDEPCSWWTSPTLFAKLESIRAPDGPPVTRDV